MRSHKVTVCFPWSSSTLTFRADYEEKDEVRTYRAENGLSVLVPVSALSEITDKSIVYCILGVFAENFHVQHAAHERSLEEFRPKQTYRHQVIGIAGHRGENPDRLECYG